MEIVNTAGGLEFLAQIAGIKEVASMSDLLTDESFSQKIYGILHDYLLPISAQGLDEYTALAMQYIQGNPNLTGGLLSGHVINSVALNEDDSVTLTNSGTAVEVQVKDVLQNMLAALGLNSDINTVLLSEDGRALTERILQNYYPEFEGQTIEEIEEGLKQKIMLNYSDKSFYVPGLSINNIKDILLEAGAYGSGIQFSMLSPGTHSASEYTTNANYDIISNFSAVYSANKSASQVDIPDTILSHLWNNLQSIKRETDEIAYIYMNYVPQTSPPRASVQMFLSPKYTNLTAATSYTAYGYDYQAFTALVYDYVYWQATYNINVGTGEWTLRGSEAHGTISTSSSSANIIGMQIVKTGDDITQMWSCGINGIMSGIDGITIQDGITKPQLGIDIGATYPSWASNAKGIGAINRAYIEGTSAVPIQQVIYYPMVIGDTGTVALPQEDAWKGIDIGSLPQAITDAIIDAFPSILDSIVVPETITQAQPIAISIPEIVFPDIPTPVVPDIPSVDAAVNGFITVYNPTAAQMTSAGAQFWTNSIIQGLKELFTNDPLDAVIGLQIVYAPVSTSGSKSITFGTFDSGVSASVVSNQYSSVDCGTISIPEMFGDVRDYAPYTQVSVYLPFVGIVSVNPDDFIGASVSIKYRVDVYTGSCLATITCTKFGASCALYQYEGNCAVQVPLTGSARSGIISGLTSVASGIAAGAATGGFIGAVAGGALAGASGKSGTMIQKSGGFSSNAGAMGSKVPYVIITRYRPYDAAGYNNIYGFPANKTVILSEISGFTKVRDIHLDAVVCTDEERSMLDRLLREGIIL